MKAVLYKAYGSPAVLQLVELEKPVPRKNEVLVGIRATSVTNADCYMRRGDTFFSRLVLGLFKPRKRYQALGTEFSGVIEAVGGEVNDWKVGDEVFGFRGFGTGCYAEYKCISAAGSLAKKPGNMRFEEAASVVDGASTALFFLKDKAKIKSGQKVLVNGASGSMGTFAVQLAKYYGAEVTGVCSGKNKELVMSLGADKVVDYAVEDFTQGEEVYDIVFDTVGKSSFGRCKRVLNPNGQYLTTVLSLKTVLQSFWMRWFSRKKVVFGMSVDKAAALGLIRGLVEDGRLRTVIDREYRLEEIAEAHAYVETGRKRGNVVVGV